MCRHKCGHVYGHACGHVVDGVMSGLMETLSLITTFGMLGIKLAKVSELPELWAYASDHNYLGHSYIGITT